MSENADQRDAKYVHTKVSQIAVFTPQLEQLEQGGTSEQAGKVSWWTEHDTTAHELHARENTVTCRGVCGGIWSTIVNNAKMGTMGGNKLFDDQRGN